MSAFIVSDTHINALVTYAGGKVDAYYSRGVAVYK